MTKLTTAAEIKGRMLQGGVLQVVTNAGHNSTLRFVRPKRARADGKPSPVFVQTFFGSDYREPKHFKYVGCLWEHDDQGRVLAHPRFRYGGMKARSKGVRSSDACVRAAAWLAGLIAGEHDLGTTEVRVIEGPPVSDPPPLQEGSPQEDVDAYKVECPRCGAPRGAPCQTRQGGKQGRPHKGRVIRAKRLAREGKPLDEPLKGIPDHEQPAITSRVRELVDEHGWSTEAATAQAVHEHKGFTRWEPSMGLPPAAVRDAEGREYQLVQLSEDDDSEDEEDEIPA